MYLRMFVVLLNHILDVIVVKRDYGIKRIVLGTIFIKILVATNWSFTPLGIVGVWLFY